MINLVIQAALHSALSPPPSLPVAVEAQRATTYFAKCHIRTFKGPNGLYANTYTIDAHGPLHDIIPSPNAQCVFSKIKGPGAVTLHIQKNGDHTASVDQTGQWVRLNVW